MKKTQTGSKEEYMKISNDEKKYVKVPFNLFIILPIDINKPAGTTVFFLPILSAK
jgi:hypothetical protein